MLYLLRFSIYQLTASLVVHSFSFPITRSNTSNTSIMSVVRRHSSYDPYAPSLVEKYGLPGSTDPEGFDPYADTVGPGIYGGSVLRDKNTGEILIGEQYQNHNERPGPIYDGNGYCLMSRAIHAGPDKIEEILDDYPQLIHDISTGGATPLHMCGMSKNGQLCTEVLVRRGANIHAIDTYGMNPLHRMASNDLAIGAEILVNAGLDPNDVGQAQKDTSLQYSLRTPIEIARQSRSINFLMAMQKLGKY